MWPADVPGEAKFKPVSAGMILASAHYDKLLCNSPHSKNTPDETH